MSQKLAKEQQEKLDKAISEKEQNLNDMKAKLAALKEQKRLEAGGAPLDQLAKKGMNTSAAPFVPSFLPQSAPAPAQPNPNFGYADEDEFEDDADITQLMYMLAAGQNNLNLEDFEDMMYSNLEAAEEDDYDEFLDEFERDLETAPEPAAATTDLVDELNKLLSKQLGGAALEVTPVVAPAPAAPKVTRKHGEFEPMFMCKMGMIEELKNIEVAEALTLTALDDNAGRNLLHYAADGGCEELVTYLLDKKISPKNVDAHKLTPLDIAVLRKHNAVANILAKATNIAELPNYFALLGKLRYVPPKFAFSKPFPTRVQPKHTRTAWGPQAKAAQHPVPEGLRLAVHSTEDSTFAPADVFDLVNGSHDATFTWISEAFTKAYFRRLSRVMHHLTVTETTTDTCVGYVSALPCGAITVKGTDFSRVALVGNAVVANDFRGKGLVGALMAQLRQAFPSHVGLLRTTAVLPFSPLAQIKTFARAVDPHAVFGTPVAASVLQEWASTATVLGADVVLSASAKNEFATNFAEASEDDADGIKALILAKGASGTFDCAWKPTSAVVADVLLVSGVSTFLARKSDGSISDVVSFRTSVAGDVNVVTLVFSVFTSLTGPDIAEAVASVAFRDLAAHVLLVRTLNGISEDLLRRAFFDEILNAEAIYLTDGTSGNTLTPLPAQKLLLPLLF